MARFTLCGLAVYFPVETWASLPYGLWHPMYLVDFVAMCLLLWGSLHSLRARPRTAPELLCAAYGWAAANGWRGASWRWMDWVDNAGAGIDHGRAELWVVTASAALALTLFALSLWLVTCASRARAAERGGGGRIRT